jgi:hypothetical protein
VAIGSNPYSRALGNFARTATDLERALARAELCELDRLFAHGRGTSERHHVAKEIVRARPVEDMTSCRGIAAALSHHGSWDVRPHQEVAG